MTISAKYLIVAAGTGISELQIYYQNQPIKLPNIIPVKGESILLKNARVKFSEILCLDDVIYVPKKEGLFVGATKEEGIQTDYNTLKVTSLLSKLLKVFPALESHPIHDIHFMNGFRSKLADDIPLIQEDQNIRGLIWAVGHYDKGIFLAPVTASVITNMIEKNP